MSTQHIDDPATLVNEDAKVSSDTSAMNAEVSAKADGQVAAATIRFPSVLSNEMQVADETPKSAAVVACPTNMELLSNDEDSFVYKIVFMEDNDESDFPKDVVENDQNLDTTTEKNIVWNYKSSLMCLKKVGEHKPVTTTSADQNLKRKHEHMTEICQTKMDPEGKDDSINREAYNHKLYKLDSDDETNKAAGGQKSSSSQLEVETVVASTAKNAFIEPIIEINHDIRILSDDEISILSYDHISILSSDNEDEGEWDKSDTNTLATQENIFTTKSNNPTLQSKISREAEHEPSEPKILSEGVAQLQVETEPPTMENLPGGDSTVPNVLVDNKDSSKQHTKSHNPTHQSKTSREAEHETKILSEGTAQLVVEAEPPSTENRPNDVDDSKKCVMEVMSKSDNDIGKNGEHNPIGHSSYLNVSLHSRNSPDHKVTQSKVDVAASSKEGTEDLLNFSSHTTISNFDVESETRNLGNERNTSCKLDDQESSSKGEEFANKTSSRTTSSQLDVEIEPDHSQSTTLESVGAARVAEGSIPTCKVVVEKKYESIMKSKGQLFNQDVTEQNSNNTGLDKSQGDVKEQSAISQVYIEVDPLAIGRKCGDNIENDINMPIVQSCSNQETTTKDTKHSQNKSVQNANEHGPKNSAETTSQLDASGIAKTDTDNTKKNLLNVYGPAKTDAVELNPVKIAVKLDVNNYKNQKDISNATATKTIPPNTSNTSSNNKQRTSNYMTKARKTALQLYEKQRWFERYKSYKKIVCELDKRNTIALTPAEKKRKRKMIAYMENFERHNKDRVLGFNTSLDHKTVDNNSDNNGNLDNSETKLNQNNSKTITDNRNSKSLIMDTFKFGVSPTTTAAANTLAKVRWNNSVNNNNSGTKLNQNNNTTITENRKSKSLIMDTFMFGVSPSTPAPANTFAQVRFNNKLNNNNSDNKRNQNYGSQITSHNRRSENLKKDKVMVDVRSTLPSTKAKSNNNTINNTSTDAQLNQNINKKPNVEKSLEIYKGLKTQERNIHTRTLTSLDIGLQKQQQVQWDLARLMAPQGPPTWAMNTNHSLNTNNVQVQSNMIKFTTPFEFKRQTQNITSNVNTKTLSCFESNESFRSSQFSGQVGNFERPSTSQANPTSRIAQANKRLNPTPISNTTTSAPKTKMRKQINPATSWIDWLTSTPEINSPQYGATNPKPPTSDKHLVPSTTTGALFNSSKPEKSKSQAANKYNLMPATHMKVKVAFINRTDPSGRLTADKWAPIEEQLLQALIREIGNSDMHDVFTAFNGFKWEKGIKVIECDNENAVIFFENSIRNMGPLTQNIEVVPVGNVLNRTIVWLTLPPPLLSKDITLKLLKEQNKDLVSENWSIAQLLRDKEGGIKLHLEVSWISMDLIKKSKNRIHFGMHQLEATYPLKG